MSKFEYESCYAYGTNPDEYIIVSDDEGEEILSIPLTDDVVPTDAQLCYESAQEFIPVTHKTVRGALATDAIPISNRFAGLTNAKGLKNVEWDEIIRGPEPHSTFIPTGEELKRVREEYGQNMMDEAIRNNKRFAEFHGMEFFSEEYKRRVHNWVTPVKGPSSVMKRRSLPARVLRHLQVKLKGKAQGLFGFDLNVNLNWPQNTLLRTEHAMESPELRKIIDALTEVDGNVRWLDVFAEVGFFFSHLLAGGLTYKNLALCFAHLVKNIPVKGLAEKLMPQVPEGLRGGAQAGADEMFAVLGTALTGVVGIGSVWAFSKLPSDAETTKFIQRFSNIGRCISSVEKIHESSEKLAKTVLDYIKKTVFGVSSEEEVAWKEVNKFCDEVFALNTPDWSERCKEPVVGQVINALANRADGIAKILDSLRAPHSETYRYRQACLFLGRLVAQQADVGMGELRPRVPPTLVHIYGDSGAGKSSCLNFLCARVLHALGSRDPADLVNKVYTRHPGSEFYDGFQSGAQICVVDDFGAQRDSETRPSPEPIEAIRMMNPIPYRPPMAHLVDKAKAAFECPLVIWTSNRPTFNFPSLTNAEAVLNRVQMKYRQFPALGYGLKKRVGNQDLVLLNKAKVMQDAETDRSVWRKCYSFQRVHPITNIAEGDVLTFDEFATQVVDQLMGDQARGKMVMDEQKQYFEDLVAAGPAQAGWLSWFMGEEEEQEEEGVAVFEDAVEFQDGDAVIPPREVVYRGDDHEDGHVYAVMRRPVPELPESDMINRWWKFVGRGKVHIDVKSMFAARTRDMTEAEMNEIYDAARRNNQAAETALVASSCVVCPASELDRVADQLTRGWVQLCAGYPTVDLLRLAHDPAVQVCYEHHRAPQSLLSDMRHTFETRFAHILQRTNDAILWLYEEPAETPLGNVIKGLFGGVVAGLLVSFLFQGVLWMVTKALEWVWPTKSQQRRQRREELNGGNERYSAGEGTVARARVEINGEGERYSAGEQSVARARVETEGTSEGWAKTLGLTAETEVKAGSEERYSAGESKVTRGQVEEGIATLGGGAESLSDQNGREVLLRCLKNCYQISTGMTKTGPWRRLGTATVVTGRVLMTNRHITNCFQTHIRLYRSMGEQEYIFPVDRCTLSSFDAKHTYGDRDVALVECPATMPLHPSLVRFFMTPEDYSAHSTLARVAMYGYLDGVSVNSFSEKTSDNVKAYHRGTFELEEGPVKKTTLRNFYTSGLETAPGDCGSLLVALDTRFPRKICGVHMAGLDKQVDNHTAVATAVHSGVVDALLVQLQPHLKHAHSVTCGDFHVDELPEMKYEAGTGIFSVLGRLAAAFTVSGKAHAPVHRNYETVMTQSPVASCFGPLKKAPARLAPFTDDDGNRIDPMNMAMEKAATPAICVNGEDLRRAGDAVEQMICNLALEKDARTLTYEESISGVVGDDCYPPINRRTSPGYGWKKSGVGKTKWLGEEDYIYDNPELLAAREKALIRLSNGQRVGAYWTDTLKDELRDLERVKAGKTRLFSAGEMVFTLLMRQFFGGFAAHMMRNKITVECCVGLDVYSLDWNFVVSKLRTHGDAVVAGDFSNYDGTLPAEVLWEALRIINNFYVTGTTPDNAELELRNNRIRELLWIDIVNSVHVNGKDVYEWNHSQPSGCPITSILNSTVHSIVVRMAFLEAARRYKPDCCFLSYFSEHVTHVNYGDDDVSNISPECAEWFNQETMAEAYATFGMTYTDESKSSELVKTRHLDEIQFLKRSFVYDSHQSRWRAPLSLETVLSMAQWNKTRSQDKAELTKLVLMDAVYELAQHPKAVWDEHIHKFRDAAKKLARQVSVLLPTYEEVQDIDRIRVFGGEKLVGKTETWDPEGCVRMSIGKNCRCTMVAVCPKHGECSYHCGECRGPSRFAHMATGDLNTTWFKNWEADCPCGADFHRTKTSMIGALFQSLSEGVQQILRGPLSAGLSGGSQQGVGGLFSPIDECAPATKVETPNRLLVQCAGGDGLGLPLTEGTKPANTNNTTQLRVSGESAVQAVGDSTTVEVLSGKPEVGPENSAPAPDFSGETTIVHAEETVTFHEDGEVVQSEREVVGTIPRALQVSGEDALKNDIIGFLSRPVHVSNISWTVDNPEAHRIKSLNLPLDWFQVPMIYQKLEGFRYLRCTFVIDVQLNAQPFNAGALLAWFDPLNQQMQNQPSNISHWAGKMGYPHVVYRCGQATALQLRIPFFSSISHYDLVRGYGAAGAVHIDVFSKLTGESAAEVDGTVWMWAENIDISMPTGLPLSSGIVPTLRGSAQAGRAEARRPGTIETISSTAARVASALTSVPVLSGVASIGETLFSGASTIAAMFGWSKPVDPEFATEVQPLVGKNFANYNGDSKSRVLALEFKNTKSIPTDVFNTTEDEMAFRPWIDTPVYFDRFSMTDLQTQGTLVWSAPVDATACKKIAYTSTDPTKAFVIRQETNLSFLTTLAKYWRGEIQYRFLVMKTPFHSGRVRLTFVPGADETTDFSTVDVNKCYTVVHDLRENADIELNVPYTFNQPWKPTENLSRDQKFEDRLRMTYSFPQGMLYVTVLNALRNPTTCSSSIEFIVLVNGGKDMQFAYPAIDGRITTLDSAPALSGQAQAGIYQSDTAVDDINASTFGEAFTGFRQLMKRFHSIGMRTFSDNLGQRDILPFRIERLQTSPTEACGQSDTIFNKVQQLFRFQSGSMRVGLVRNGSSDPSPDAAIVHLIQDVSTLGVRRVESGVPWAPYSNLLEPVAEYQVPMYQPWVAILTSCGQPADFTTTEPVSGGDFRYLPSVTGTGLHYERPGTYGETGEDVLMQIFYAIGEDYSMGFRQGIPLQVHRVALAP